MKEFARMVPRTRRAFETTITRYLFVADGPAAWVVRDVLAQFDSTLYLETVGALFLGSESRPGQGTMNYELAIEKFLEYGFFRGGRIKLQRTIRPRNPAYSGQSAGLAAEFEKIDIRYARSSQRSGWGGPMTWHMTVFYEQENGLLQVQDVEQMKQDLQVIITQAAKAVADEAAKSSRQDKKQEHIKFKRQQRSESMDTVNDKAVYTRPFDPQQPWGASPSKDPDEDDQGKLTSGSWPSELEEYFRLGVDILHQLRFPQDALAQFDRCQKLLKMATATPTFFSLELEMNSALALTYLGRYDHANSELAGVLRQVNALQKCHLLDAREERLLSSITQETSFRLAYCLTRTGRYSLARRQAHIPIDEEYIHVSQRHPFQYYKDQRVIQVNTYCIRDLIEAYLGSFVTLQLCTGERQPTRALYRLKKLLEENNEDPVELPLFRSLELTVKITLAKTAMLQGDYKVARSDLLTATEQLQEQFGSEYLTKLEALLYYARSLVCTCNHDKAMGICNEVKHIAEKNFDSRHPLCLEATYIQVLVYRAQGSSVEALYHSQHLLKVAAGISSYDSEHPTVLECVSQIGSLLIYDGKYCSAEGVACLSELAWARCHLGKHKAAEEAIGECLHRQLKFYWPQLGLGDEWDGSSAKDCIYRSGLVNELQAKIKLEKRAAPGTGHNQQLHPDLLYTLYITSQIEMREELPNWGFIDAINSIVLNGFELRLNDGNEDHERTMRARLAIGHAQLAKGRASHDELLWVHRKAHKTFESVLSRFVPGSKRAESHPLALHARRESIMSDIVAQEDPSEAELRATRDRLRDTFSASWRYLGGESPDTLLSLFYLLSLDVILEEAWAAEAKDRLLALLRKPNVLKERFVETLALHERVAKLYWGLEKYDTCRDVVNCMRTLIDTSSIPSNDEMHDAAKTIVERAELLLLSSSSGTEPGREEERAISINDGAKAPPASATHFEFFMRGISYRHKRTSPPVRREANMNAISHANKLLPSHPLHRYLTV
ncbi:uncharacterized protein PG998_003185 [Apiospora kogelbergensis]|uniref:uncharacterized protein n=1 Tax=Apiospora kogelbergensis TaxID=1337665 RepID=UPI003131B3DA